MLVPGFCTAVRNLAYWHSWLELKFMGTTDGKDLPPDPFGEVLYESRADRREFKHLEYNPDGTCYIAPGLWRPPNAPKCALHVTAYFGRPRGVGVESAMPVTIVDLPTGGFRVTRPQLSREEKRKVQRDIREMLRQAQIGGWNRNQDMHIDTKTTTRHIQEQLAIFLERVGIGDESTRRLLGFGSKNTMKQGIASRLVGDFVGLSSPASYPAYKRTLRERIVGPDDTFRGPTEGKEPAGEVNNLEDIPVTSLGVEPISEEVEQIRDEYFENRLRLLQDSSTPSENYSVREAAKIIGISWRKLYDIISAKACSVKRDRFGRIRVPLVEVTRLRQEFQDDEKTRVRYRSLVEWLAGEKGIKNASARR